MSECKRFSCNIIRGSRQVIITDCKTRKSATIDVYDDDFKYFVDLLNELAEENEQLRKVCSNLKKENQSLIDNIFDIYEKVKWVGR